ECLKAGVEGQVEEPGMIGPVDAFGGVGEGIGAEDVLAAGQQPACREVQPEGAVASGKGGGEEGERQYQGRQKDFGPARAVRGARCGFVEGGRRERDRLGHWPCLEQRRDLRLAEPPKRSQGSPPAPAASRWNWPCPVGRFRAAPVTDAAEAL